MAHCILYVSVEEKEGSCMRSHLVVSRWYPCQLSSDEEHDVKYSSPQKGQH
jgi:hypothetical protein